MNVAVVGGGIVGLSAGRFLASRGHRVALHERFPLFHDRGSSHGRSRIVRRAYPDAFFTACMSEAYPMWADLEAASDHRLVDECGLLYFGGRDAERVVSMVAALESIGVPHQILKASKTREMIPQVKLADDEVAVFTPEAGWVDAEGALRATYALAQRDGMELIHLEVPQLAALEREYDAVVLAPGPWIQDFIDVDVRVTIQTFAYVDARIPGPVWIDDPSLTYGFPSDDWGQKIGAHLPGPDCDPDNPNREPVREHLLQIEEVARRRFGGESPVLAHTKTCLYTNTPDEDFRLGRTGTKTFFASACSGHGFKMGPWIGKLLADFVEGVDTPENHPRFLWPR